MPRHVPDDFSFLPSVDSTEEEVVERKGAWQAKKSAPRDETPPAPPPVVEQRPVVPQSPPPPARKQRVTEPDVSEALESTRALSASSKHHDAAPLPTPRAPGVIRLGGERESKTIETPRVSLGSSRATPRSKERPAPPTAKAPHDDLPTATSEANAPVHIPKPPPEEPDDPDTAKRKRWRKLAEKIGIQSLGWSVGVHFFILLIAAFIGVSQVMDKQVDFLPGGSSPQSEAAAEELTHKIQQKKNPWLKSKPRLQAQTLNTAITLPEMPPLDMPDFSKINDRMDLSKVGGALGVGKPLGMGTGGAGGGFGGGIGRGGRFSFVGQTALGKRVVFVVDVSGSMSAISGGESISRFDLLKKELVKTLNQMPMGTQYQILFFSDFAWPHDQVDSRNVDALMKYKWEVDSKNYKRVKIPTFRYIPATPFSLPESVKIVQNSDNPGGTNWGSGLLMALNASPKPDVIFFMTDGLRSDEQGWVDIVTDENKRRLPVSAIYTSAMQEPDAARDLDALAKRNNGRFTVVLGDGKIVKGEDFLKGK
jgi:hypothetical protein